jgi:hypothetical protein
VFDEVNRQVKRGAHRARGHHARVVQQHGGCVYRGAGVALAQRLRKQPSRGGAAALQQPSLAQYEGAHADRRHRRTRGIGAAHKRALGLQRRQRAVPVHAVVDLHARHDEGVVAAARRARADNGAARNGHAAPAQAHDVDLQERVRAVAASVCQIQRQAQQLGHAKHLRAHAAGVGQDGYAPGLARWFGK